MLILAFLPFGKNTVKDSVSIVRKSEDLWNLTRFRQISDSLFFRNIIKYEKSSLVFQYLDPSKKQIGGKVKAHTKEFNVSQLRPYEYHTFGYFNNYKIVLAKFKDSADYFNEENALFDATKSDLSSTNIISKQTYEIDENGFTFYKVEVNPSLSDLAHEHIEKSNTELIPKPCVSFREAFYHNLP